jgi:hypothetical protein
MVLVLLVSGVKTDISAVTLKGITLLNELMSPKKNLI